MWCYANKSYNDDKYGHRLFIEQQQRSNGIALGWIQALSPGETLERQGTCDTCGTPLPLECKSVCSPCTGMQLNGSTPQSPSGESSNMEKASTHAQPFPQMIHPNAHCQTSSCQTSRLVSVFRFTVVLLFI